MNIYKLLLFILTVIILGGMFIVIEAVIFDTSILGGIIANSIVALIFFLMYKSNKHDVEQKGDEQNG